MIRKQQQQLDTYFKDEKDGIIIYEVETQKQAEADNETQIAPLD
jgi:hypothetical protein